MSQPREWSSGTLLVALQAVYSTSLDGVVITGQDERIAMVNTTYAEMTGYAPEELIGERPNVVASGLTPERTYEEMWRDLRAHGRWSGEVINERKDGHLWYSFLSITRVQEGDRVLGYIGIARDVTKQKQALLAFKRMALLDEVTGLFNRRYFDRQLPREVASAQRRRAPVSLLMIDIDDFKSLNDRLGHRAGDGVLGRVAAVLSANVRAEDIPCRYGGEEFAVILPQTGSTEALRVAERLRWAVSTAGYDLPAVAAPPTVSVGVCTGSAGAEENDSLVGLADRALYRAKAGGKNQVRTCAGASAEPPVARPSGRRRYARQGTRAAIPCLGDDSPDFWRAMQRWGVRMLLQPVVDLRGGTAAGYEALARGRPGSPVETAQDLFRAARHAGYSCALSGSAGDQALKTPLGPGQTLFVNIDPSLAVCPYVAVCPVYRWLERSGTEGGLVLEISERTKVQARAPVEAFVERSRRQGHRIALDDVGTAYAGLQTLLWLKPEYLKVDRSLIAGIDHDRPRAALVRSLLDYARLTGARSVAEGIETAGELRAVIGMGADLAQGFFLQPPAPDPCDPVPEALAVIREGGGPRLGATPRRAAPADATPGPVEVCREPWPTPAAGSRRLHPAG